MQGTNLTIPLILKSTSFIRLCTQKKIEKNSLFQPTFNKGNRKLSGPSRADLVGITIITSLVMDDNFHLSKNTPQFSLTYQILPP